MPNWLEFPISLQFSHQPVKCKTCSTIKSESTFTVNFLNKPTIFGRSQVEHEFIANSLCFNRRQKVDQVHDEKFVTLDFLTRTVTNQIFASVKEEQVNHLGDGDDV